MTGATCFSGIGAPEVALPSVEWRWCAEIEKFPARILAHHRPHVPNLGDVTAPDFIDRAKAYGELDLLVAGSPCQAFSVAGHRRSLADDRGNLTLRLVEIIHAIKPRYLLWENVPGVLSTDDNAFGCFLGALVGADSPLYPVPDEFSEFDGIWFAPPQRWTSAGVVAGPVGTAAWRVLDAQYFGLAQRRRRVFLVFCFGDRPDPAEILFEFEGMRRDSAPSREAGKGTAHDFAPSLTSGGRGVERAGDSRGQDCVIPILEAGARTGASTEDLRAGSGIGEDGDPMFTLQAGKQHGVFSSTGELSHCLNAGGMGRIDYESETLVAHSLRADGFDASEDGTGRGTPLVAQTITADMYRSGGATAGNNPGVRTCIPVVFDPTQITSVGNYSNPRPGDPCHPLAAQAHPPAIAFSCKDHGADASDIAPTLRSMEHDASHANAGGQVAGSAVRRLTPKEAERLQGFPDDYTAIDGAADGPRYKALGNSMAVPVIRWIGQRIQRMAAARSREAA